MKSVQHILLFILVSLASAIFCQAQETAKASSSKPLPPAFVPPAAEQPLQPFKRVGAAEVYFYEATEDRKEYTFVRASTTVYAKKQGQLTLEQLSMFVTCRVRGGETAENAKVRLTFRLYRLNAPKPLFIFENDIEVRVVVDGELLGEGGASRASETTWSMRNSTEAAYAVFTFEQLSRMAAARQVTIQLDSFKINLDDEELAVLRDVIRAAKK